MRLIRILQISDILAGSPQLSAGKLFDELISWVNDNSPNDRMDKVDYIVVCGNVTADGKPESFEIARTLLRKLGDELLVEDPIPNERWLKKTWFNRMMVVPGRTDIPIIDGQNGSQKAYDNDQSDLPPFPRPDFRPFKDFHDKLFSDELNGRVLAYEPG
ncbi:MAG TPA: metallophosphoesterase, partial [Pyrinomonadaceae bacterium]|nr:metallophosphoesterase [Pyrinomonadaceae bacterium]